MGSRGSVIPIFLRDRDQGNLQITDKRMTRFSVTLQEGVNFVNKCFDLMAGGELFVPKTPSYRIMDVAKAICPDGKYEYIGLRPGEKVHEEMITAADSARVEDYGDYFVVGPTVDSRGPDDVDQSVGRRAKGTVCAPGFSYSSDKNERFLSYEEIKDLIIKNVEGGTVLSQSGN